MVRQVRNNNPSNYPSPPGGNVGGIAKHIFEMWTPDFDSFEGDVIAPGGSYETDISQDDCNTVIKIYFVRRGFRNFNNQIKTLISTFVQRNPYCGIKPSEKPITIVNSETPIKIPDNPECSFPCCVVYCDYEEKYERHETEYGLCERLMIWTKKITNIEYPLEINGNPAARITFQSTLKINQNIPYLQFHGSNSSESLEEQTYKSWEEFFTLFVHVSSSQIINPYIGRPLSGQPYGEFWAAAPEPETQLGARILIAFDYSWMDEWRQRIYYVYNSSILLKNKHYEGLDGDLYYARGIEGFLRKIEHWDSITTCGNWNPSPPPPLDECCMSCCPKDDSSDLLRAILKKLNKLSQIVGVDDYPVAAPTVLTNANKGNTSITNLTRFLSYSIKQLDALCGKFPIEIEIEDTDLTQEGNQTKTIKLPNISEALAELMGIAMIVRTESDATLNAAIRTLIEAGSTRQTTLGIFDLAQANAEFLGYKLEQIQRDIPFAFSPGEEQLEKILKEKTMKVVGYENTDKENFNSILVPLLELAAMWKAQNFRNLGANNPLAKLTEILGQNQNLGNALSNIKEVLENETSMQFPPPDPTKPPSTEAFDEFVEQAEVGFIAQPGITDTTKPYGRKYERRPKIREIGTDTSDTESNP